LYFYSGTLDAVAAKEHTSFLPPRRGDAHFIQAGTERLPVSLEYPVF